MWGVRDALGYTLISGTVLAAIAYNEFNEYKQFYPTMVAISKSNLNFFVRLLSTATVCLSVWCACQSLIQHTRARKQLLAHWHFQHTHTHCLSLSLNLSTSLSTSQPLAHNFAPPHTHTHTHARTFLQAVYSFAASLGLTIFTSLLKLFFGELRPVEISVSASRRSPSCVSFAFVLQSHSHAPPCHLTSLTLVVVVFFFS